MTEMPEIRIEVGGKMDNSHSSKPTVDFTVGLPGCGKSTWTKAEQAEDPTIVRINNDDLGRAMSIGRTPENAALLATVRAAALNQAISQGRRVIVDNTNLSPKAQREILTAAARDGRIVRRIDFTGVSAEECIRRDALRTGKEHVGAKVINGMVDAFLRRENPRG